MEKATLYRVSCWTPFGHVGYSWHESKEEAKKTSQTFQKLSPDNKAFVQLMEIELTRKGLLDFLSRHANR